MKRNGNHQIAGDYYIGLDVGSNSVGWAVTDKDYNILKFKGNAMWGVRLFEEEQNASARRVNRANRRRLARRNQRLLLLQMLFAEEIARKDAGFFMRLQESALHEDDKAGSKFAVFADDKFTDKEYHKKYPTVYHLRNELAESTNEHDVRLVFMAVHHILKKRGHFLYETADSDEFITLEMVFEDLCVYLEKEYSTIFRPADVKGFFDTLQRSDIGINAKKKALRGFMGMQDDDTAAVNPLSVSDMLAGATVNFSDLFRDERLKKANPKSFCLKNNLDDNFDAISSVLDERVELLVQLKSVYDAAKLSQILSGHTSISKAKIALFEKNKKDLALLKKYVRTTAPEKYKRIFSIKTDKLNNFPAYNRYRSESGDYTCSQEDFCKFLRKELPAPSPDDEEMTRIFREIQDNTFLTKLRGSDNGVIPYQLHKQELLRILENASSYLSFLNECDPDGITVKDKIIKIFEFRTPYYVGPLNSASPNHWAVRFAGKEHEKVYPWNFETVVDTEASAGAFIDNLIGRCTYTGEKVLPKDSLLYSEYMLRNEMNLLRVNGNPLPCDAKEALLQHFFFDTCRKVTKRKIYNYLLTNGLITQTDEISGIDDTIQTSLRSYRDFREILDRTGDYGMVEAIIRSIVVFGEDKAMLRRWLKKNTYGLTEEDYRHICRLKYNDWGRLSETFLTGLTNNGMTIMDCLRETDCNIQQLLTGNYQFASLAKAYRDEVLGNNQTLTEKLDSLYIAPVVRRSIRQALRIVDEIVDIRKAAPAKIFIEVARGNKQEMKGKRTESRKAQLTALYKTCGVESTILFKKLENEDDNSLRRDKLYLYYLQLGKCMYTGEPLDFESLLHGEQYDIDHIFPQSKIRDNSLDNRVLVRSEHNREKNNIYPISSNIREKMLPTWQYMKSAGFISQKKYDRLSRNYPLTEAELSAFVARQLTEAQHPTRVLSVLLKNAYADTKIVYSNAGNVSDFRHDFNMIKCQEVNDLHHAKDAYLNIVVGNVYCTKFTDRFFADIHKENYSLNKVFDYDTPGAWNKETSIATVKKHMAKNNPLVVRMPREVKGQLFDLQLMPAGKGQLQKKTGLSVNKYGGYNKLYGAYFCVVEYTGNKNRVRALQPVYVYKKDLFERDPVRYCEKILGLTQPKIIAPKIRFDAMLELDGKRLLLSGRTNGTLVCKHSYQLAIDAKQEGYIRNISKYVERCAAYKTELSITDHDGLSVEENTALYDWFLEKCDQQVYADLFRLMKADMVAHHSQFDSMSMLGQCKLLLEILKAFKCNAQAPDFSELCGKKTVARITKSMNLSNFKTARLINQSVTGLYETSVDLLR